MARACRCCKRSVEALVKPICQLGWIACPSRPKFAKVRSNAIKHACQELANQHDMGHTIRISTLVRTSPKCKQTRPTGMSIDIERCTGTSNATWHGAWVSAESQAAFPACGSAAIRSKSPVVCGKCAMHRITSHSRMLTDLLWKGVNRFATVVL